jgi:hypothetical protein
LAQFETEVVEMAFWSRTGAKFVDDAPEIGWKGYSFPKAGST